MVALSDSEVVARVSAGETAMFEILMRRHNQRAYRVARAIVRNEDDAEDVMQQAYLNAYAHLNQFEARAQFSTWLTRIVINAALATRRRQQPERTVERLEVEGSGDSMEAARTPDSDPERQAYAGELRRVIEHAVDALPDGYRLVFVMRDVEGFSTSETAEGLQIGEEAVKTRLHRARAMLRRSVAAQLGDVASRAFEFQAPRCDRVVAAVMAKIAAAGVPARSAHAGYGDLPAHADVGRGERPDLREAGARQRAGDLVLAIAALLHLHVHALPSAAAVKYGDRGAPDTARSVESAAHEQRRVVFDNRRALAPLRRVRPLGVDVEDEESAWPQRRPSSAKTNFAGGACGW